MYELLVERRVAVEHDADGGEKRAEVDRVGRRDVVVAHVGGDLDRLLLHIVVAGVDEARLEDRVEDVDGEVGLDLECVLDAIEDVLRWAQKNEVI